LLYVITWLSFRLFKRLSWCKVWQLSTCHGSCHDIMLSCLYSQCHVVILSCYHVCIHNIMLSCVYSQCHVVMSVFTMSCCHVCMSQSCSFTAGTGGLTLAGICSIASLTTLTAVRRTVTEAGLAFTASSTLASVLTVTGVAWAGFTAVSSLSRHVAG